jgi:hypothetical protein
MRIKQGDGGIGFDYVDIKVLVEPPAPRKKLERRLTMEEKRMVHMYDPSVDAFREVPLEKCIKTIKEAKKMEKDLLVKGILTEEVKVE